MELHEILAEIHRNGLEFEVIDYFNDWQIAKIKKLSGANAGMKVQLGIIKKLNKGKNKAIENMCEVI